MINFWNEPWMIFSMTTTRCADFPSILCDGKTLAVVHEDEVWVWDDYLLKSLTCSMDNDLVDCIGLYGETFKIPGLIDFSLDLNFRIGPPKRINKSDLKIGKDLFNNLTVNELISIIKSKIKQREN